MAHGLAFLRAQTLSGTDCARSFGRATASAHRRAQCVLRPYRSCLGECTEIAADHPTRVSLSSRLSFTLRPVNSLPGASASTPDVNSALKPKTDSSPCNQIRHWQARAHIDDGCDHLKAARTLYASLVYSLHSVASASNAMPRQCDGLCGVGVARPVRSERNVHDPVLLPKVRLRCGLSLVALLGWACILCEPKPSVDSADRSLALAAAWR